MKHSIFVGFCQLVPLTCDFLHLSKIEAGVVDENGVIWSTGPRATISVRSYDENIQRQQQQQQQQMRARAQQSSSNQQLHYTQGTHA